MYNIYAPSQDYTKEMNELTELIGRNMKIRVLLPAVGRAADTVVSSAKHSMFNE